MNSQLLSIVIPVYNEEQVISLLREKMEHFRSKLDISTEVILVDDGSEDQTPTLLKQWANNAKQIQIKTLEKNVGHQIALQIGLELANGDYVVTMDADLQDPLETIPDLLKKSRQGYDIVHAQRIKREGESVFRLVSAWLFYRLIHFVNSKALNNVGDFRLLTRKAHRYYLDMDKRMFMRGELVHLPFPQSIVRYKRQARVAGKSKFSLRKLLDLAWMGFRSFWAD